MKPTKRQGALFYVGCLLVLIGLWMVWLPLAVITAGLIVIALAVCLFNAARDEAKLVTSIRRNLTERNMMAKITAVVPWEPEEENNILPMRLRRSTKGDAIILYAVDQHGERIRNCDVLSVSPLGLRRFVRLDSAIGLPINTLGQIQFDVDS